MKIHDIGKAPEIRVGIMHSQDEIRVDYNPGGTFTLHDVCIGIDFHWQRRENQTFRGRLDFVRDDDGVWAVNTLPLEEYLKSVVSSEMSADSALEFLKAHAVIARSWALAADKGHELFDVCADDHCQRYQGITRMLNDNAQRAVEQTRGQVLTYGDEICDTRYSKCCGGRTEIFSTCWEGDDKPYLQSVECQHCNIGPDDALRRKIFTDFDQETTDFFEWRETLTRDELSARVAERLGCDLGEIVDLIPLQRGRSGRISHLRIVGSKASAEVSRELAIRRVLSSSHLRSSWFDVHKSGHTFTLHGHGWGHGVGLCQIGAAVMGEKGYSYEQILKHYYPGTEIYTYE